MDGADDGDDNDGSDGTTLASQDVTFLLSGFDAPAAGDDHAIVFTIGHIGLHDADSGEWVPILTESIDVTVFFDGTAPAAIDTYALLARDYDRLEILIDNATVLTPTGTESTTVDQPVCYTAITLGLNADTPPTELELLVSGEAALRGNPGAWTVRPAVVGSLTDDPDDDPVIQDVDCANV